jgi:hypothetical protein
LKEYFGGRLKKLLIFTFAFIFIFSFKIDAQKKNASYQLQIHRTFQPIKVDGEMDDEAWTKADSATNFLWCCQWIPLLQK